MLVTGSLNRPRQAKVRNQAWGPSRGPRQSGAAGGRTGNKATVEIQGPSRGSRARGRTEHRLSCGVTGISQNGVLGPWAGWRLGRDSQAW